MVRKILILTASPSDAARLRADKEMQKIQEKLEYAPRRRFRVIFKSARPDTFLDAIEDDRPEIVHFCGHGTAEGIVLESETGDKSRLIPTRVLRLVFKKKGYIKCVLLNACHSEIHASAISEHIPYTIGMEGEILDRAAIAFAGAFYKHLGNRKSIKEAFEKGYVAACLIDASDVPKLFQQQSLGMFSKSRSAAEYFVDLLKKQATRLDRRFVVFVTLAILSFSVILGLHYFFNPPQNSSSGERVLLAQSRDEPVEQHINNGVKAFADRHYEIAIKHFDEAIKKDRKNPELYIYRNNAYVRQKVQQEGARKHILAVSVPAKSGDSNQERAREMLRGIADAQVCFNGNTDPQYNQQNCLPNSNQYLLEVEIFDDKNDAKTAVNNAESIVDRQEIMAVIGHYSSEVTEAALDKYSESLSKIPVVSTATSSDISLNNFYRVVPSTKLLGKKLAEHIKGEDIKQVFVIEDELDTYSGDSADDFEEALRKEFDTSNQPNIQQILITFTGSETDTENHLLERQIGELGHNERFAVVMFPTSASSKDAPDRVEELDEDIDSIAKTVRSSGDRGILLGGNALLRAKSLKKDSYFENMIVSVPWFYEEFIEPEGYANQADSRWGGTVNWATAGCFDATQTIMSALMNLYEDNSFENVNYESEGLRQKLLNELGGVELTRQYTSGEDLKFSRSSRELIEREARLVQVVKNNDDNAKLKYKFKLVD